jgi:sugar (pentulose or hexulose) kinase
MISWFKNEFAGEQAQEAQNRGISLEALLDEQLADVPAGCRGLMLTPYWGPGLKMPEAKGSIIGFGDVHTRAYVYRAIIEGINYALLEGMESLQKRSGGSTRINRLMVSGGGSKSEAVCQITADMFGMPVYRGVTSEASGLGAAINGFVGLGAFGSYEEAVKKMVHYAGVCTPEAGNAKLYRELYSRVYRRIYPRLAALYAEIQSITDYPKF